MALRIARAIAVALPAVASLTAHAQGGAAPASLPALSAPTSAATAGSAPAVDETAQIDDPRLAEIPGAARMRFVDALERAVSRNPSVAVAREEVRRAEAIVTEVRAGLLPTLTGQLLYTRLDADRVSSGKVIAAQDQLYGALTLTAPLFSGPRLVQYLHAREQVDVTRGAADESAREIAISVARTYATLLTQHRALEVLARARATAQAHLRFAHDRFAGGFGTRTDEVRASQELAVDETQLEQARINLVRSAEALGVLVGDERPVDVDGDLALPEEPAAPDRAGRGDDALETRSDVRLGRLRLVAAEHVKRDDWADYVPSLVASFQPFFQLPPTLTLPQTGWQGQVSLLVPFYDGGLRYGQSRERASLVREARLQLDSTLRQARSDVRTAHEEVARADAALAAGREAARLAREALDLVTLAFRAGTATGLEVIDAERAARDADSQVALAEDAARTARLDALIADGRFPTGTKRAQTHANARGGAQ